MYIVLNKKKNFKNTSRVKHVYFLNDFIFHEHVTYQMINLNDKYQNDKSLVDKNARETFVLWKMVQKFPHDQYMTGQSKWIFSYSSNASDPHVHPCPPPLQPVPVPQQALLLKVKPIHSHTPLHDSHKGYVGAQDVSTIDFTSFTSRSFLFIRQRHLPLNLPKAFSTTTHARHSFML